MKAFTSLEQSRRLAEILPIKSADMWLAERYKGQCILNDEYIVEEKPVYYLSFVKPSEYNCSQDVIKNIPCWSLTALLKVLPYPHLEAYDNDTWVCSVFNKNNHFIDDSYGIEPIDVCYEMIIKLYEQKLL